MMALYFFRLLSHAGVKNMKSLFTSMVGTLVLSLVFVAPQVNAKSELNKVRLNVELGQPVLLAERSQTVFLKIGLTGFEQQDLVARPPVNIAIVLDKSGSMSGQKMEQAKEAAILAIQRLRSNDIVSVVAYDNTVEVIWPASRVDNKPSIIKAVRRIQSSGNTALFAGVSKGAGEVRHFLTKQMVNRVILLSDGLANVGPSTPSELGQLGLSLSKEGISVTTIGLGLGYNEDLMVDLAGYSDGNHSFAENAQDLIAIFDRELSNALSVVAKDAVIEIHCAEGIQPLRVIGRESEILGQKVKTRIGQLYSEQEKYLLLEVKVPATNVERIRNVANVEVSYNNIYTGQFEKLKGQSTVAFTQSEQDVVKARNTPVIISTVKQIANEESKRAVKLRDRGDIKGAETTLNNVSDYLQLNAVELESEELSEESQEAEKDANQLTDEDDWRVSRKKLKAKTEDVSRQSYRK